MNIMTKRGSEDNVVTYEHYCDTKADLINIPQDQITLGSVAIVLKDEDNSMGIYMANSNKEWISFSAGSGGGGNNNMENISLANLLDISLANPTDGQTLVYNSETEKWENKNNVGKTLKITMYETIFGEIIKESSPTYEELLEIDLNDITAVKINKNNFPIFSIHRLGPTSPFFVSVGRLEVSTDGNSAFISTFLYEISSEDINVTNGPSFRTTRL